MKNRLYRVTAMACVAVALHGCKGKSSGGADGGAAAATAPAESNPLAMLNGFEGELSFALKDVSKNRPTPEVTQVLLQIKNEKVRAELPQSIGSKPVPKGYAVLSAPEKKLSVVMDEQKQIVVVDLNAMGEQLKSFGAGMPKGTKASGDKHEPSKPPPKVTKTGVTDKVAGFSCENWEVAEESRKVATLCITDQSASWFRLPLTGIPTEYAWALELMDGKHFPVRMIGYDSKTGAEQGRVELTKLEKKTLAASLFDMPAGYKVVDVGSMLAQLGGMGAMGAPGAPGAQFGGFAPPGLHPKKTK
jgi:hypothetical protein